MYENLLKDYRFIEFDDSLTDFQTFKIVSNYPIENIEQEIRNDIIWHLLKYIESTADDIYIFDIGQQGSFSWANTDYEKLINVIKNEDLQYAIVPTLMAIIMQNSMLYNSHFSSYNSSSMNPIISHGDIISTEIWANGMMRYDDYELHIS
jgi:hypothetical protein